MAKLSLYAQRPRPRQPGVLAAVAVMVVLLAGTSAVNAADAPCGACVAVAIAPGQILALPEALHGLVVLLRVSPGETHAAVAALEIIAARGGHPGLLVLSASPEPLDAEALRRSDVVLIDVAGAALSDTRVFNLKRQITAARGEHPGLTIGLALAGLAAPDLVPYIDFVLWRGASAPDAAGKGVWTVLDEGPAASIGALLRDTSQGGADKWLWNAPAEVDAVVRVMGDLARAARWLPPGLIASPSVRVTCGGTAAAAYLNPQTLETIAIARRCAAAADVAADPPAPGIERVSLSSGDTLIRVPAPDAPDRFAEGVQVVGARTLSVEEIVARHQAFVARQASIVRAQISTGTLTLTFEAPGFPAPVTISAETVIYSGGGRTELEQRAVRVNGIEFRGGGVPRLPIIEPERVASPPLAITLTSVYRYRLDGRGTVDGTPCYIIAFEPAETHAARKPNSDLRDYLSRRPPASGT